MVDPVFAADGLFEEMDFPTRTLYRKAEPRLTGRHGTKAPRMSSSCRVRRNK
jgi:hypothetical protein